MSPSAAISGFGATLTIGGTQVAQVNSIVGVKISRTMLDATAHDSADGYEEFKPGLKKVGEIPIKGYFKPSDTNGQIAMQAATDAGTLSTYVISAPSLFTWTATAYCMDFEVGEMGTDGLVPFTATLKVSGKPVLAITTSANLTTLTGIEENTGAALTFTPAFDGAKYVYNVAVNTASTWVKFTPTLAGAVITIWNGISSQDVLSGAQSGTIAIVDAAVTTITLSVKETGKVSRVYTVHVYTP